MSSPLQPVTISPVEEIVAELRAAGATSLPALAVGLTRAGIPAPRGLVWSHVAVLRMLKLIPAPPVVNL